MGIEGGFLFPVHFEAAHGHAVVSHEDDEGVFELVPLFELLHEEPEVGVDVLDHAIAGGGFSIEAEVFEALDVFLRGKEGAVRGVERDVGEVGLLGFDLLLHPAEGGLEEDIGAEAFRFDDGLIVEDEVVEVFGILVTDEVAKDFLAESSCAVDEDFIEPAIIWEVFFAFVTEVPLAEDAVFVSGLLDGLGEGGDVESEALAAEDGVGDADGKGRPTAHEGGASWSAGGVDLELGEAGGFFIKGVDVGSLEIGVSHAREVAHALVVGQDVDDVWTASLERQGRLPLLCARREAGGDEGDFSEPFSQDFHFKASERSTLGCRLQLSALDS